MARDPQGRLQILNIQTKEQLQGLPVGYTAAPGVSDHARHRALANAWRLGIAKTLLHFVLVGMRRAHHPAARAGSVGLRPEAAGARPCPLRRWRPPPTRPLDAAAAMFRRSGTPFGPPPPRRRATVTINDMAEHRIHARQTLYLIPNQRRRRTYACSIRLLTLLLNRYISYSPHHNEHTILTGEISTQWQL